jgi:hypothetical protein
VIRQGTVVDFVRKPRNTLCHLVFLAFFGSQEEDKGRHLWHYHFEFSEVMAISNHDWEAKRVVLDHKGVVFQRAFQPVDEKRAKEWLEASAKVAV